MSRAGSSGIGIRNDGLWPECQADTITIHETGTSRTAVRGRVVYVEELGISRMEVVALDAPAGRYCAIFRAAGDGTNGIHHVGTAEQVYAWAVKVHSFLARGIPECLGIAQKTTLVR